MLGSTRSGLGRRVAPWGVLALSAILTAACGTEDPGASDPDDVGEGPLLPWQLGNTWTYRVTTDTEDLGEKVTTVGEEEPVGGTGPHAADLANRVVTSKRGGADETVSWQARDGDRVLRYREQSFNATSGALAFEEHWDPYKLHIDGTAERRVAGARWVETYSETKTSPGGEVTATAVSDTWEVRGVGISVTVAAGTFETVALRKTSGATGTSKDYFYAPGVGKVREVGGQTEELVSFDVTP